ncbi:MAG: hypothetical protein VKL42_17540 [Snowella sp.]|nr:hypothetical protein [Snowella sp.]
MQNKLLNITKKSARKIFNIAKLSYDYLLLILRTFPRLVKLAFLFVNIIPLRKKTIKSVAFICDFSGLHLNLKRGFVNIGLNCVIYSDGDSFKRIPSDLPWISPPSDPVKRLFFFVIEQPLFLNSLFLKHDVVQIIAARFIHTPNTWQKRYLAYLNIILRKSRARFVLTVAGCDHHTQKTLSKMERSPCPGCLKDMNMERCFLISQKHQELQTFVESKVDMIMPLGGEAYLRAYPNASSCLPFPLEIKTQGSVDNSPQDKIKILHGISRAGFKGSDIIISALSRIKKRFPDIIETLIVEKLTFEEYLLHLNEAHIVVDQAFGDALGYNSLYSLSLGKIVFSSHSSAWILSLYGRESPAIDFWDEDSLYCELVKVCSLPYEEIGLLGRKGYEFVQSCASPEKIAHQALSLYLKL